MKKENSTFYKEISNIALPIALQAFMLAIVSVTDALMLGFVNQDSFAAVSLAGQIQFVLSLIIAGMTGGISIMAAQYWGKGDSKTIERIVPIALRVLVIAGAVFTIIAAVRPQFFMGILTNDAGLLPLGTDYIRAVAPSYFLCAVAEVYLAVLRATGKAKLASNISVVAVVVNIILNAILIFGLFGMPALGIVGAAYATSVARLIEFVWGFIHNLGADEVKVRWKGIFESHPLVRGDFWKYTTPMMLAAMVWGIAYTLYSVIMGHMGSDAVAANSITSIAKSLVSCVIRGFGTGAGILVGNVLGSGDLVKAKLYGKKLKNLSIILGAITGGLLIAISPIICKYVDITPTAAEFLKYMLVFCGFNIVAQSINHCLLDGVFGAGGDTLFDMYGNIGAMWCFSVPFGFIAAFVLHWSPIAVYCIVNLDEIVKLPAVFIRFYQYKWVKNITRDIE